MAPTNERTKRVENAIKLRMRLGLAFRRLYFNTELGTEISVRARGAWK